MFAAICDDEKVMQNLLTDLLNEYGAKKGVSISIDKYGNGYELLRYARKYDLIFMDYRMDGLDGIETARKIREASCGSGIIFVSAFTDAALDSFEVDTFRFLRKPVDKPKLFRALDDYIKSVDRDNLLLVKSGDSVWKVRVSDIVYAEAKGKHTVIRTADGSLETALHLKAVESRLPPDKFVRCHRAYIAGFRHISNHSNSGISFDNGEKALIGKVYLKKFKEEFKNYIVKYNSGML